MSNLSRSFLPLAFTLIATISYSIIVKQVFTIWTVPTVDDLGKINNYIILIAFEFVLVHSGVLMAEVGKNRAMFLFIPLYGVFAVVFNLLMSNNVLLYLYCLIVFNRMSFIFSNPSEEQKRRTKKVAADSAILYFLLAVLTVIASGLIPKLGLNAQFLLDSNYYENLSTRGLWPENPHLPIAMTTCYFSILAIRECLSIYVAGKQVLAKGR